MAENKTARLTVMFPKEVTKALRMKAISDESSPSEIIMNALALTYEDDPLLTKPLENALSTDDNEDESNGDNETAASEHDNGYQSF